MTAFWDLKHCILVKTVRMFMRNLAASFFKPGDGSTEGSKFVWWRFIRAENLEMYPASKVHRGGVEV